MPATRARFYGVAFLVLVVIGLGVFFSIGGRQIVGALFPNPEPRFAELQLQADGTLTIDSQLVSDGDLRGIVYDASGPVHATVRIATLPPRAHLCEAARQRLVDAGFSGVRFSVKTASPQVENAPPR